MSTQIRREEDSDRAPSIGQRLQIGRSLVLGTRAVSEVVLEGEGGADCSGIRDREGKWTQCMVHYCTKGSV